MEAGPLEARESMKRNIGKAAGSLLITALLLWSIFAEHSLAEFAAILANIDTRLLLAYSALSVTALLLRAMRYRILLSAMAGGAQVLHARQAVIVAAIRNALVDFLPARLGEASYIYVVSRYGVPLTAAVSSFGFCFLLDIVILLIVIALAVPFGLTPDTAWQPRSFGIAALMLFTGLVLLAALLLFGDALLRKAAELSKRFPRLEHLFDAWAHELREVRASGRAPALVLLTLGLRAAKYASLYLLLLSVVAQWQVGPGDLPVLPVVVAFIAAEAGASLPVSGIMSFGAYEGAWSAVFSLVCRGPCESVPPAAVALAVHLVTQLLGYSLGIIAGLCFFAREMSKKS